MILELFNNYRNELIILAWLSAALLLVSIAVIPWIVIKIPEDSSTSVTEFESAKIVVTLFSLKY